MSEIFPLKCLKNIGKLMKILNVSAEKAYDMMRMTAALSDLDTDDDRIVEFILLDCGVEVEA